MATVRQRIAMGISYTGSAYHGWQYQNDQLATIQQRVEQAISRVANHGVTVVCAGRTDAGVHATNQVIHFDTDADRSDYSWVFGTNSNLPHDISVDWAKPVPLDFHARFTATSRHYRYIIYNQLVKPAILRDYISWYHNSLDVNAMQTGANYLIGEHDFSSFRGADCQSHSAIRTIETLTIKQHGQMIVVDIIGNAFLLHMVRNIMGVLIPIGNGTRYPDWAKVVLEARKRSAAGVTTSPNGLYLVAVSYPQEYDLPHCPLGPFFLGSY